MLSLPGPLLAVERHEQHLVSPAAAATTGATELLDAFVIGEGEEVLVELLDVVVGAGSMPDAQPSFVRWPIAGLYIPSYIEQNMLKMGD